ncbi:MAG: nucleotidyltransferase domain-containing protein [Bacteroidetes bacterium]|nr:MAG: nucleotidyltransferase domain-containing protein [Bacteroidota bacterium]
MIITEAKIREISDTIAKNYAPDKIILFGSYATGNYNENSDIDLLIIKDTDRPRYKRGQTVRKFLYGSMVPIDIVVYTNSEVEENKDTKYTFIYEVLKTGKVIYDKKNNNN